MNKIVLKRIEENKDCTIGEVRVFDNEGKCVFSSYSLEPAGDSSDEANKNKRIVAREYHLKYTQTSVCLPKECEQKGILLTTDEVKDFEKRRILVHVGNYSKDTQGCILLGEQRLGFNVLNSQSATKRFYGVIKDLGIENCELEIKEIGED